ncbi:MAG TPA: DUF998 domain-containing protein [bacterium]|nr:DUF998 domain-containing protein [bacterium]
MKAPKKTIFFVRTSVFSLIGIMAYVHLVRMDLNALRHSISRYAYGAEGSLLRIGMILIGTAQILLGYNLPRHYRAKRIARAGLVVAGIGILLAALFPVDLYSRWSTTSILHNLGGFVQFIFLPLALLAITQAIDDAMIKNKTHKVGRLTIFFTVVSGILFYISNAFGTSFFGLVQKIAVILMAYWINLVSRALAEDQNNQKHADDDPNED